MWRRWWPPLLESVDRASQPKRAVPFIVTRTRFLVRCGRVIYNRSGAPRCLCTLWVCYCVYCREDLVVSVLDIRDVAEKRLQDMS